VRSFCSKKKTMREAFLVMPHRHNPSLRMKQSFKFKDIDRFGLKDMFLVHAVSPHFDIGLAVTFV